MQEQQLGVLLRTVAFAADKHKNQRRKSPDALPYINHPIEVANHISDIGGIYEIEALQAAVLHDTVEDTDTTFEELEKEFGVNIANIVREVTDNKDLPKKERKKAQIEHAKHASYHAKLVKLADKLNNLRDLIRNPPDFWDLDRILGYFVWSYKVIEGLRGTNEHLEKELDLLFSSSFQYKGNIVAALPPLDKIDEALQDYYNLIDNARD